MDCWVTEYLSAFHTPDKATCWGIVTVVGWNPRFVSAVPFEEHYAHFTNYLQSFDIIKEHCFIYPYNALHTTLYTIINFKENNLQNEEGQHKFENFIASKLKESLTNINKTQVKLKEIRLSQNAGFFQFHENEEIEKIRDRLQASLDTVAQQLKENEFQEDLLKSANRPRIIHSTIMRFTKTPDDWENFESEWQTIINNFISRNPDSPLLQECLDVSSIHVVVEKLPYMQRSTKFAAPLEVLNVNLQ